MMRGNIEAAHTTTAPSFTWNDLRRRCAELWSAGKDTREISIQLSDENGRHVPEHTVANELARMRDQGRR